MVADDKHKCCLGLTYYNRSIEQQGKPPVCLGLRQSKEGDIDYSDSRHLSAETRDFKYYCLGYAIHPESQLASQTGNEQVLMPYCEGVEVAVTEEPEILYPQHSPAAQLPNTHSVSSSTGSLPGTTTGPYPQHAQQTQQSANTDSPVLTNGSGLPGPSSSRDGPARGNDPNRQLHTRFMQHLNRNASALWSVVSEGIPTEKLPVGVKEFGSVSEFTERLSEVASSNASKVSSAASLASSFAYYRLKEAVMDRLRGTEPEN